MRASARATAAAVVLGIAAGCGSDGYGSSGTPAQCSAGTATALAAGTVTLSGNVFQPACAKVAAGTVVTFANADPVAHTVTADAGGFDHLLGAGQQATQRFAAAGAVGIHCTLHPGMRMTLIVQ